MTTGLSDGVQLQRIDSASVAPAGAIVRRHAGRTVGLMLRRRHRWVGGMILVGLLIGAAVCRFATPRYTATAQMMLQRTSAEGVTPTGDRTAFFATQQQLVTSTAVLAMASSSPGIHELSPLRDQPDPLKALRSRLSVSSEHSDDLITVSFESADRAAAVRIVSAVMDSFVRFESGLQGGVSEGSAVTLAAERARARENWRQQWDKLQEFGAANGLARGDEQMDAADAALHELAIRVADAHVDTITTRAAFDAVLKDLQSDPTTSARLDKIDPADDSFTASVASIDQQIAQQQAQLQAYGGHFMANYPAVLTANRKLQDLKVTRAATVRWKWHASDQTEQALRSSYDQQRSTAASAELSQATFQRLRADVAEAQKQIDVLDARLKALDPADASIKTIVTITEPPAVLDRPTFPDVPWTLSCGAIAGLLLGCVVGTLIDARALPTVHAGGITKLAGQTVLAKLPAVQRRHLTIGTPEADPAIATALVDACQTIAGRLADVSVEGHGLTVAITSSRPREGKSTLTSLLAATFARKQCRVLILDANFHAPVQGRLFDVESERGLADLLSGDGTLGLRDVIQAGRDGRVDVMLPGITTAKPQDLLNTEAFIHLMSELAHAYDIVLIDTPALSVNVDARVIAGSCDASVVIAQQTKFSRRTLARTCADLTAVGGNVLGVVLNAGMEAVLSPSQIVNVEVARRVRPEVVHAAADLTDALNPEAFEQTLEAARQVEMHVAAAAEWPEAFAGRPGDRKPAEDQSRSGPRAPIALAVAASLLAAFCLRHGLALAAKSLPILGMATAITRGIDVTLWFAALAAVWTIARGRSSISSAPRSLRATDGALILFSHASLMAALMILLSNFSTGPQLLAVVAVTSALATLVTDWIIESRISLAGWIGPLLVAILGYVLAGWTTMGAHAGPAREAIRTLARPSPLAYASMAPLGTLVAWGVGRVIRNVLTRKPAGPPSPVFNEPPAPPHYRAAA